MKLRPPRDVSLEMAVYAIPDCHECPFDAAARKIKALANVNPWTLWTVHAQERTKGTWYRFSQVLLFFLDRNSFSTGLMGTVPVLVQVLEQYLSQRCLIDLPTLTSSNIMFICLTSLAIQVSDFIMLPDFKSMLCTVPVTPLTILSRVSIFTRTITLAPVPTLNEDGKPAVLLTSSLV